MSPHEHAPCIKDPVTLHLLIERQLIPQTAGARLHGLEGCGNCPSANAIGSCAILNTIGEGKIAADQKQAIISKLTS